MEVAKRELLRKAAQRRKALQVPGHTNTFRLVNGEGDALPGFYADLLGDALYLQIADEERSATLLEDLRVLGDFKHVYVKRWHKRPGGREADQLKANALSEAAPERLEVFENGVRLELRPLEGYSHGLFLDQRGNRARIREVLKPGQRVLNAFSYTCAFSVLAASAGAATFSVDLSKKYLEWGKANFALNGLPVAGHEFVYGDVRDWLKRLHKKGRRFDLVVLDPPTFANSKEHGVFRVEEDYPALLKLALSVMTPRARLLCSQNKMPWAPAAFEKTLRTTLAETGTRARLESVPQPVDFPGEWERNPAARVFWLELY